MKQLVRRLVNSFGFDIVRSSTLHRDIGEHLLQILKMKEIDAVIDVGANVGQYGQLLRRIGYAGEIYSFEPVSYVFDALAKAANQDSKWHCFRLAIGEESTSRKINVYDSHVFSSFLQANEYGKSIWKSLEGVHEETVDVVRLDSILADLPRSGACRNFMLKMDTQGFDLQVFRGASGILPQVTALQSELALLPIYDDAGDPYSVLREFNDNGFWISGMYPINRDASMAVIEYDVTLVRR